MIGLVLAAGTNRRLRSHASQLPKTLVPLGVATTTAPTPLDVILGNFAAVGVTTVGIVVGYAAEAIRARQAAFEKRYGLTLELIPNDRADDWNNCYSLWCARDVFTHDDVLLANGDTVHPVSVERTLLERVRADRAAGADPAVLLAVDTVKQLGDEEMKVTSPDGRGVGRITKLMEPEAAYGEYIGVAHLPAAVGPAVAAALEATWRRDPSLYYEDGFQRLVDTAAAPVEVQPIGATPWIEIDEPADLARAGLLLPSITAASDGTAAPKSTAASDGTAQDTATGSPSSAMNGARPDHVDETGRTPQCRS